MLRSSALTRQQGNHPYPAKITVFDLMIASITHRLSFPPQPFRYQIRSYYNIQTSITFSDYGPAISHDDAVLTLLDAQIFIMAEMAHDPQHGDRPVGQPLAPLLSSLLSCFFAPIPLPPPFYFNCFPTFPIFPPTLVANQGSSRSDAPAYSSTAP